MFFVYKISEYDLYFDWPGTVFITVAFFQNNDVAGAVANTIIF